MNEKIKNYLGYIPIVAPIIYFFGFVAISGYLSNFGVNDYNIFNVSYLKSGILLSFFISIVFISIIVAYNTETMTDDLKKSWPSVLTSFYNTLFISMLVGIYLLDFKEVFTNSKGLLIGFGIVFLLHAGFRVWSMGKTPNNNFGILFLTTIPIVLSLIVVIIFCYVSELLRYLLLFNFALFVMFTLAIGAFGDKEYKVRIITDLVIIIVCCFLFGKYIYSQIPTKFGGGQPYKIAVYLSKPLGDKFIYNPQMDTLSVLYENDVRYLVKTKKNEIIFLKKEEFKEIRMLNLQK
jgi:hypothetical protein